VRLDIIAMKYIVADNMQWWDLIYTQNKKFSHYFDNVICSTRYKVAIYTSMCNHAERLSYSIFGDFIVYSWNVHAFHEDVKMHVHHIFAQSSVTKFNFTSGTTRVIVYKPEFLKKKFKTLSWDVALAWR
jgi:hypothetical protein